MNSELKGGGDLDAASIAVLVALGLMFVVFCLMIASELYEYNEATSKRDNEDRATRKQVVETLVQDVRVRCSDERRSSAYNARNHAIMRVWARVTRVVRLTDCSLPRMYRMPRVAAGPSSCMCRMFQRRRSPPRRTAVQR